jgi:hypothetical protein
VFIHGFIHSFQTKRCVLQGYVELVDTFSMVYFNIDYRTTESIKIIQFFADGKKTSVVSYIAPVVTIYVMKNCVHQQCQ